MKIYINNTELEGNKISIRLYNQDIITILNHHCYYVCHGTLLNIDDKLYNIPCIVEVKNNVAKIYLL